MRDTNGNCSAVITDPLPSIASMSTGSSFVLDDQTALTKNIYDPMLPRGDPLSVKQRVVSSLVRNLPSGCLYGKRFTEPEHMRHQQWQLPNSGHWSTSFYRTQWYHKALLQIVQNSFN